MRSKVSLVGLLLILLAVNLSVALKEKALASGRTVILELVPVDPRSLMQGDYMRLRYAVPKGDALPEGSGLTYVQVDSRNVAIALSSKPGPGLVALRYRKRETEVALDAESYFFEEGHGFLFDKAKYGELRVDAGGTPILVRLLDSKLTPITP